MAFYATKFLACGVFALLCFVDVFQNIALKLFEYCINNDSLLPSDAVWRFSLFAQMSAFHFVTVLSLSYAEQCFVKNFYFVFFVFRFLNLF